MVVEERVEKFKRSKETPTKHALILSTKDLSPMHGWRAEREVGLGKLQVNFKTNFSLAGVEGWALKLEPGEKQTRFQTELQREECFWATENKSSKADAGIKDEPSPARVRGDLKQAREFEDHGLHKTTSKDESRYENHNVVDDATNQIQF